MKQVILFLTIFFCSISIFGQKLISEKTILITDEKFNREIIFNSEALYDFSGDLDKSVLSIINADEFLNYVITNARKLLYTSVTDEQVEKFKIDFKTFFNSKFTDNNSYVIQRPSYSTAMEWRNALTDMNYAMFFVLRKEYFFSTMIEGKIKFQFTKNNDFAKQIQVDVFQNYNKETGNLETRTKYILDKQDHEIYSNLKTNRIDKSKIALSNPNPIEWETKYKENNDGTFDIILSAQIVKLWSIFALNQSPENELVPKTIIRFNNSTTYELVGALTETKVKPQFDKRYNSKINFHTKNVEFTQKIKLMTDKPLTVSGNIFYMLSTVESLTPKNYDFKIEIKCRVGKGESHP